MVSRITGIRLDIYVASPSLLLSGHDVSKAHTLLQALAAASMVTDEVMSKAVEFVADAGYAKLYNKTRVSFTSFQALYRGWLVRKERQLIDASDEVGEGNRHDRDSSRSEDTISSAEQRMTLAEKEYEALILRKSKVAEEIIAAEAKLNKENDKLVRVLKLKEKAKARTTTGQQQQHSRPQTAPSVGGGFISSVDEQFAESIIDMKAIQLRLKQKEKIFLEREQKLKQRLVKTKNHEAELQLQTERVTELADKIRKQQLQMKEQKWQLERAKARPPETAARPREPTEQKLDMKKVKALQLRQRMRLLNRREANILRMAKELKKREMQLAKREDNISAESHVPADDIDSYEKVNSMSTKTQQISLIKKRRRSFEDNKDGDDVSVSSPGDSDQCSSMKAIEEEDEEDETSAEEQGEVTSMKEETPPRCADQPPSASNDNPTKMPPNRITTPATNELNHHPPPPREGEEVGPSHKKLIPPQQSHYSNHVFSFEKNNLNYVDDLGHNVDAQLRCAVNNLRELL